MTDDAKAANRNWIGLAIRLLFIAALVVVALALWARDHKDVLALRSQDHNGTYGESHRPWSELLTYLAVLEGLPADGPPPPATSPSVLRLPQAATGAGS